MVDGVDTEIGEFVPKLVVEEHKVGQELAPTQIHNTGELIVETTILKLENAILRTAQVKS